MRSAGSSARSPAALVGETSRPSVNAWIQVLRRSLPSGQLEQRPEVLEMAVHATAGDEPEQVDVAVAVAGACERADERLVLEEGAVLDRRVHAHQVLKEDPPRADRQVAYLGVPHLTGWEPDRAARGLDLGVGKGRQEPVEHGRRGKVDGIARPGRRDPPAVQDHQRDERTVKATRRGRSPRTTRDRARRRRRARRPHRAGREAPPRSPASPTPRTAPGSDEAT